MSENTNEITAYYQAALLIGQKFSEVMNCAVEMSEVLKVGSISEWRLSVYIHQTPHKFLVPVQDFANTPEEQWVIFFLNNGTKVSHVYGELMTDNQKQLRSILAGSTGGIDPPM